MATFIDFTVLIDPDGAGYIELADEAEGQLFAGKFGDLARIVVPVPEALGPFYESALRLLDAHLRRRGL